MRYAAKVAAYVSIALAFVAGPALAQGSSNTLNFTGGVQFTTYGGQLFIDFLRGGYYPPDVPGVGSAGDVYAGSSTGVFSGVSGTGTIQDLQVDDVTGFGAAVDPYSQRQQFLTIGGYTFSFGDLPFATIYGPITVAGGTGGTVVSFTVTGNVTGAGFGSGSTYTGLFTSQFTGETPAQVNDQLKPPNSDGTTYTPLTTFSASFTAASVTATPEPATWALMTPGLLGILGVARRRRGRGSAGGALAGAAFSR